MAQVIAWILAGIIVVGVGGLGMTALALSYWDDIQQRRVMKARRNAHPGKN